MVEDFHAVPRPDSSSTPPPTSLSPQISRPSSPTIVLGLSDTSDALTLEEPFPLLRVRKALTHLPPNVEQYDRINAILKPLLPSDTLLQHRLVLLPTSIRSRLNASLQADENSGARPLSRHGSYIATDEPHAMLVQDMTAGHNAFSLQLKPKWVVQSPNAPRNARRCRTCALRQMRESEFRQDKRINRPWEPFFCPLDLASGQREGIERAIDAVLSKHAYGGESLNSADFGVTPYLRDTIVDFLLGSPTLPRLRELQQSLDPTGVLSIHDAAQISEDFQVATTLRDCSLFVRISWLDGKDIEKGRDDHEYKTSTGSADAGVSREQLLSGEIDKRRPRVEGLLGDLDLKRPQRSKLQYWRRTEESLIRDGWYHGRRAARSATGGPEPEACLCRLERGG